MTLNLGLLDVTIWRRKFADTKAAKEALKDSLLSSIAGASMTFMTISILSWFTPIRDLGLMLLSIGVGVLFAQALQGRMGKWEKSDYITS